MHEDDVKQVILNYIFHTIEENSDAGHGEKGYRVLINGKLICLKYRTTYESTTPRLEPRRYHGNTDDT